MRTTCPYCGVGCGLVATVRDGRLAEVAGDPLHPVNHGATCRKPLRLPDAVHAADRATIPLLRETRDERWRQVTWRMAIGHAARRLGAIAADHGPDAIAFYISGQLLTEDYYVANKLVKGFLGTNNLDSNSRLCMSSAVAGYREAFGSDGPPPSYADIDQADCMLLLGSNTAACHPILWSRIRRRQAEGATVIVVDPRRTATAEGADLHLPVRPGQDLPLLNAIAHVLARDGLVDAGFLARRTEGAEELLVEAAAWTPERAAAVCGVEAEAIEAAARAFGRAGRAMTLWSMGANQSTVGVLKNRALINLCLLTGNLGKPGCGPLSLTGQPNAMGGRESGGLSTLLPGYRSVTDAGHRAEMEALWSSPPISSSPGVAATDLVEAIEQRRVRAVWIVATNPVVSQPDAERFAAALRACELVVVQDAYHPTETAALAHLALPAAQWPEKEGVMTNSERRLSLVARALHPPGRALADWQIFARLGRALGHREAFAWERADEVFDEYAATTAGRLCDVSDISHARLRREGPLQWGGERLYASGPFPTDSGRARLTATPAADPVDAPDGSFPLTLVTGRVAGQWHTMTRTAKSPDLMAEDPEPFVELNPSDAGGLASGQRVRVVSRRGEAHLRLRVSDAVAPGVAFAPFHWGALHLKPGEVTVNAVVSAALDPVSRQPELKATAVRVEKVAARSRVRRPQGRVLVVGGGMAGAAVARELCRHGEFAITLAGEEPDAPYDRVRLSSVLAGEIGPEAIALEAGEVSRRAAVARLDLGARAAVLDDGAELEWDRLVIATGSRPALPPIEGLGRRGVHAFRSLADVRALLAAARPQRRAVVIGGGLLGLEAARGLQVRGMRVTVVHLAPRLMEQQLDGPAASLLERRLRDLGLEVLLGASTSEVVGNGVAEGVRLADGRSLEASLVVVATGIRPEVALARDAGLEVRRGVVVDDELRASGPGVWAVGECAEHRGTLYGLWAPLARQARVAAAVIAGRPAAFHGVAPSTTLKVAGADLFCAGRTEAAPGDEEVLTLDSRAGRYRRLLLDGERLVGAILLGDLREAAVLRELIETARPVPPELLESGPAATVAPPATVCSCNDVARETVAAAIAAGGLERIEQVARETGATTGCGGCRTEVQAMLDARPLETLRDGRPR